MRGMDSTTGRAISGLDHMRQRITNIITTAIGSSTERRDYGSRLPRMVDRPVNPSFKLDTVQAIAEALAKWEFEFKFTAANLAYSEPGTVTIDLFGESMINGEKIKLEGLVL